MRAALLREIEGDVEVVDVDLPAPAPGQVRVRMAASGVCHSDLSVKHGTIPFPLPAVLGHEGAGVVAEVGEGVTRVEPGDHVVLVPMPACRACAACDAGQPFLCDAGLAEAFGVGYGTVDGEPVYAGFTTATFAEEVQVLEKAVVKIDPDIPLDVAALVGCAVTTGVGAVLNTAAVEAGETVAVIGCGGVGQAVVQGAVVAGAAQIIAVDPSADHLQRAAGSGATDTVRVEAGTDPVEAVRDLTGGRGADHTFEVVGRSETIRQAFDAARRGGTVTVVGAGGSDDVVGFTAMEMFFEAKRLLGCLYGSADADRDFPRFLALHQAGRLHLDRLIGGHIGLEGVNDAFAGMEAGTGGRQVIALGPRTQD